MAIVRNYKCKKCGFEVVASAQPYTVTMSGLYAQCFCKKCDALMNIDAGENYQVDVTKLQLRCSKCGEHVSAWSPDQGCPHCGGAMKIHDSMALD